MEEQLPAALPPDRAAPNSSRRAGWALIIAGLLPLLLACWHAPGAPRGRELNSARSLPPLGLVRYAVNLRELPAQNIVPAQFSFWNRGGQALEIVKVEPSCGCLSPTFADRKMLYQPGEEGQLFVSVKTANEPPGPALQWVKLHYRAGGETLEQLVTFRYTVPELKVSVSPVQLNFYQLNGEPGESELKVLDSRRKNLQVLSAQSADDLLELEVGERSLTADGVPYTSIRVHVPGPVAAGRRTSVVVIRTDDASYPELRVPVVIQGPSDLQLTSGVVTERDESTRAQRRPAKQP